jgi:hypothetical protein
LPGHAEPARHDRAYHRKLEHFSLLALPRVDALSLDDQAAVMLIWINEKPRRGGVIPGDRSPVTGHGV